MRILQELLNLGLMDIGSDDARFSKMETASAALVDRFESEPDLIIPATLVSIDSDIGETEPFFDVVEDLVIEQWKTMRNTHVNRPRELLRAIIINALVLVTEGSPEKASAIYQTAISPLNHGQAKFGKEGDLINKLVQGFGGAAENEAAACTSLVPSDAKKLKSKQIDLENLFNLESDSEIEDGELIMDVVGSAGPNNRDGNSPEDPNPHWPNAHTEWAYEFAPRMTAAMVKAVNLGMNRVSEKFFADLQQSMGILEEKMADHFESIEMIRSEMFKSQQFARMRLDVLWWSKAKYSPALKIGYRNLPAPTAALAMAVDLTKIVPPLAPASVTYVLGETVAALFSKDKTPTPQLITKYLDELYENDLASQVAVPKALNNSMRQPLLGLIAEAISEVSISSEKVQERAGLNPNMELSLPDFAMWIFRDLQAQRLIRGSNDRAL